MNNRQWGIRAVLGTALVVTSLCLLAAATPIAGAADGDQSAAPAALAQPGVSGSVLPSWSPLTASLVTSPAAARGSAARPRVTRLSRASGKPGTRLTISGRNFGKRRGKGAVLFGSSKATRYLRWSRTRIVCKVPAIPAGKVTLRVRTAGGTSRGRHFTVGTSPVPATLPAGALMQLGTVGWTWTSSYPWQGNWAEPDPLYYYTDDAGSLAIVGHDRGADVLTIDTYNPATLQRLGETKSISFAGWPDWGGFYAGPDGCFYVLVGRENLNEDDTLDVVAVRRYDHNWTLVGTAYVQGGATQIWKGIYSPFVASAAHMVLVGNRLVVHMGRLLYAIDGVHHQANFTFEVDVDTMTASTLDGQSYANCGHSFQQLICMNGSNLVMIDHGDYGPRAIQMGVIAGYPAQRAVSKYNLFEFNGAIGDNFTGATVTGLVSGPSGIVVVGNSIRQPDAPNGTLGPPDEHRNIYAVWAYPATGAHTVRWLTDFAPQGGDNALEPRVVQVGSDRWAVLFGVRGDSGYRMEYRLIDSAGTVLASTSFPGVFFCAASNPIMIDGKVYWVGIKPDSDTYLVPDYLFGIEVSDPMRPSLLAQ